MNTYCSLFWLFLFGSVAGFILEGFWCILQKGAWESHSSTVLGLFCIIYGFGAAVVYLISMVLKGGKSTVTIFPLLQPVFPLLARLLGKMEGGFWQIGCVMLSLFTLANLLLSAAAVMRWKDRLTDDTPTANAFKQFLDETYNNDFMKKHYPNMKFLG